MSDQCTTCGAVVQRYITLGGRTVDLETEAHENGNYVIEWANQHIRARVLTGPEMPSQDLPAFKLHLCPATTPRGPSCGACGREMPREIATLLRWTDHPACDPDFLAQLAEERLTRRPTRKARR